MPTPYDDQTLSTTIAREFAREVKAGSGGALHIRVRAGASLLKHPKIPQAVMSGQVQIAEMFIGILGDSHPIFKHDNIPFLATNYHQARKLWLAAKPEIKKQLREKGLVLLYTTPWPAQGLYTQKPIHALSDIKGTKMRVYSASTSRLAALMNTQPTLVQVPELYQAFSKDKVNAMFTSSSTGVHTRAWNYLDYFTKVKAWIPKNFVVANENAFKRLNLTTQIAIINAAAVAEKKGWEKIQQQELRDTRLLAENGMKVEEPSETLINELKVIGATMAEEWQQESPSTLTPVLTLYRHQKK
ncbi:TRAP transporter substrate-binding protein [Veronia pacifica]|nr:TRAP transporter substrate-binding protein [Veronia pacifica]